MAVVIGKPYDPPGASFGADESFDPLVEFAGVWTTDLAERYLPLPDAPPMKYECLDGNLIMSPREAGPNGYAMLELGALMRGPARDAGYRVYPAVNLRFDRDRWIEPDLTVLLEPCPDVWVENMNVLLVGECISPSSKRRDRLDKPAMCAEAGIPYYLLCQADLRQRFVSLELSRLEDGEYQVIAEAVSGKQFETDAPFALSFDPIELLDIRD
ncbi:Uma2 family endonuclease [Allokutzneria sp. NRRL B-24872]|uniref:Uma2 family endonuclease n=1 Tax=Allokutzneria sp. NRRL B-24872 TaxID=1137961 RepID=UPI001FED338E|nr:Uma2 family endonuclease [Allokutzneria sp. NRRL B-24872]